MSPPVSPKEESAHVQQVQPDEELVKNRSSAAARAANAISEEPCSNNKKAPNASRNLLHQSQPVPQRMPPYNHSYPQHPPHANYPPYHPPPPPPPYLYPHQPQPQPHPYVPYPHHLPQHQYPLPTNPGGYPGHYSASASGPSYGNAAYQYPYAYAYAHPPQRRPLLQSEAKKSTCSRSNSNQNNNHSNSNSTQLPKDSSVVVVQCKTKDNNASESAFPNKNNGTSRTRQQQVLKKSRCDNSTTEENMSPSMTSCSPTTTTRTTTTGDLCKTRSRNSTTIVASNPPTTEPIASNHNNNDDDNDDNDDDLDDYAKFVKSLGLDNDNHSWLQIDNDDDDDDEEDDFFWTNYEDDNEEDYIENHIDDSDEEGQTQDREAVTNASPLAEKGNKLDATTVMPLEPMTGFDLQFYKELEEELGGLEEEDLEAAVANLIGNNAKTQSHNHHADFEKKMVSGGAYENATDPYRQMMEKEKLDNSSKLRFQQSPSPTATPLKQATARKTKTAVDPEQVQWLQNLLQRHYQLLIQQAVLAIHTSYLQRNRSVKDKAEFLSGETGDDLIEILDSAVGMMQDLEQNRKDAIRYFLQLEDVGHYNPPTRNFPPAGLHGRSNCNESSNSPCPLSSATDTAYPQERRLTRAAFSESLKRRNPGRNSIFDIKGLHKLQETFRILDSSVGKGFVSERHRNDEPEYTAACRSILEAAEASSDADILPGTRDLSVNFSFPREYLGEFFKKPCDEEQSIFLLKNKNFFTAGEDNLVLRGVNLYGEKQWALIVDRFLSDRSINVVSQRYSKLCVMLYKANGVSIDSRGNLDQPPHLDSVDDIDDRKVALIPKVSPPAILNVHRWSLEEDLTLLRAVPLMGPMWAELGARLIPHRDRGHLRKRYQVLERRVKATVCRSLKNAIAIPKPAAKPTRPPQQEKHNNPPRVAQGETGTKQSPVKLRSQYPQQKVWSETKARASSSTYHAEKPKQMSSVHEPYYPPAEKSRIFSTGTDAGTSRAAFEKLASESTMGWSQMSRIREVIENGDESDIVDALSSKPKSLDTNPPMESSQSASNSVGGIMASVLERANGGHTVNNCVDKKMNSQSFALKTNRRSAARANESPQHDVEQSSDPGFDVTNTTDGDSMLDLNGMTMNMGELSWGDVRGGRRQESSKACCSPSKISLLNDPLMEENDLEAISALNALSHSPGGAFSKIGTTGERSSKAQTRDDKTKEQLSTTTTSSKRALPFITAESEHTSGAEGENKGSFFSKVVGGIRERVSKKRKLSY